MEFRVLQYFLAVAQEENISRAAEVLHLTQPTLSRQIAQLEEELGTPLFIRGKRTVLTDAGMMLRRKAEEVAFLMDAIKMDFITRKDMSGVIRIGSGVYAGSDRFFSYLPAFSEKFPKIQFELHTGTADWLKERLDHSLLDFAILQENVDISAYDFLRLPDKDEWGIVVSVSSPMASWGCVTKEKLAGRQLMMSRRPVLQGEFKNWFGDAEMTVPMFGDLTRNMLPIVATGFSGYLCIRASADFLDTSKLVFLPLRPKVETASVFVWKKLTPVFGPTAEFLSYVRGILSEHARE